MERYLIIKQGMSCCALRLVRSFILKQTGTIHRNYCCQMASNFTFAINIGKIEEILEKQVAGCNKILMRVGKSHIINKNHILQINLPKQRLLLLTEEGKPKELVNIAKDPLKVLKDNLEKEMGRSLKRKRKRNKTMIIKIGKKQKTTILLQTILM